jgi:uncharacterized protein (DUF433 family)
MALDDRFTVPLYTIGLAASHLGMKPATLARWANKSGLLTTVPATPKFPRLPFIALAEAQVYQAFKEAGLSMQAITSAMENVRKELGPRMLQKDVLAHDGSEILMNLAASGDPSWTRARDMQGGLPKVIEIGLKPISWDEAGLPETVRLTAYGSAPVIADYRYSFGQPIIEGTMVRAENVVSMFKAGDTIETVAEEMDISPTIVESIVRTHVALAA